MTHVRTAAIALAIAAGFVWPGSRPGMFLPHAAASASQGVTVQGDVVDAISNTPIPGAVIELLGPASESLRAVTDPAGHFVLQGVAAGGYRVLVSKDGYLPGAFGQSRPHGAQRLYYARLDAAPLHLRLWRPSGIAGVVRDGTGAPLVGASVQLLRRLTWTGAWQTDDRTAALETDPQGQYRFDDLEPGEYLVAVLPSESSADDGQTSVATFYPGATDLLAALTLSLDAGDARAGIDVAVQPEPAVSVTGTLAGPQAALVGARVDLYRRDAASRLPELIVASTMSESGGKFHFDRVPAGSFVIEAVMDAGSTVVGAPFWGQELLDVAGANVTEATVTMQSSLTVSGRMEFAGGSAPNANERGRLAVALQALSTDLVWPQERQPRLTSGPADDDGRFTVTGLPPGRYVVAPAQAFGRWTIASAMMNGQEATERAVPVGSGGASDLVVTFSAEAAELSGEARTSTGEAAEGSWVVLFPAERDSWHQFSRRIRTAALGQDGLYVFDELPAGSYYVVVTDDVDYRSLGPSFFESLVGDAVSVRIDAGEKKAQALVRR